MLWGKPLGEIRLYIQYRLFTQKSNFLNFLYINLQFNWPVSQAFNGLLIHFLIDFQFFLFHRKA